MYIPTTEFQLLISNIRAETNFLAWCKRAKSCS